MILRGKLTGVTVVGIHAGFASLCDFQVGLGNNLVQGEGTASQNLASIAVAAGYQWDGSI